MPRSEITVLAGTNGAGKSSVLGAQLRSRGSEHFDPDRFARDLRAEDPGLSDLEATTRAWRACAETLKKAVHTPIAFTFETTLGGRTISRRLIEIASAGGAVRILYVGLEGVELHIRRVRERVERGGHAVPEERIRARYDASRENLIRLIPHLDSLHLHDNSTTPKRIARMDESGLTVSGLHDVPRWAKPIVAAMIEVSSTR